MAREYKFLAVIETRLTSYAHANRASPKGPKRVIDQFITSLGDDSLVKHLVREDPTDEVSPYYLRSTLLIEVTDIDEFVDRRNQIDTNLGLLGDVISVKYSYVEEGIDD